MDSAKLLSLIYRHEEPILQANKWPDLRVRVSNLIAASAPASEGEVLHAVLELRREGRIMLLPDWNRWGEAEDAEDGTVEESKSQVEPQEEKPANPAEKAPTWQPRKVFLPRRDHLKHWFVRSRIAETVRLLASNRERFGLEPATAHLGYNMQERRRPKRVVRVADAVNRMTARVASGAFPGATRPDALRDAIAIAGAGIPVVLGQSDGTLAAFQERSWAAVLDSLFGGPDRPLATMQTAGVSSGKTFGFLLPAMTLLVYRLLCGEGGVVRVLVVYPRTSLVEDQYNELRGMIDRVNTELDRRYPGEALTEWPALDAGNLLSHSIEVRPGSLADVLPEVERRRIEIILTTPESLKNRMLDPRAMRAYLRAAELVVFDEIHLLEGLAGCQQIYLIRRLGELMRQLRGEPNFAPVWVGASATVAQPLEHAAQVFSIANLDRITDVRPLEDELEPFAIFHHAFIHTRVGKASISAVTNGLSCLTHTRNDGTAHTHYANPSAAALVPRLSNEMPKTIVFVDSLSTIGRLDFTTRDNERCWNADEENPYPYYTWFYRPASRLRATENERKSIKALPMIRDWCQKCIHGIPDRIEPAALEQLPPFLRTSRNMNESTEERATPPGLKNLIPKAPQQVGNLDQCPFHKAHMCWWFSQDRGDRRQLGQVPIYIDQNRTVVYTSHTAGGSGDLSGDVNDYFRRDPMDLWFVRDGDLRFTLPKVKEPVSTMLASPRIEVGVDFTNVRDGLTHKTLRSAASFQQKVGRVGREPNSDSLIVTFLAHRSVDAHFAHYPDRLIDSKHLDPIPLESKNPDVLATHLFTAALEFLGSRPRGVIPGHGELLAIVGTGSQKNVPESWEAKVRGCLQFLQQSRQVVLDYILRATGQPRDAEAMHQANAALDALSRMLGLFVIDLTPAFVDGGTAARWFKENRQPNEAIAFGDLVRNRQDTLDALDQIANLPPAVMATAEQLRDALRARAAGAIATTAAAFHATMIQHVAAINPALLGELFRASGLAHSVAVGFAALPPTVDLEDLFLAREIVQTFFRLDRDQRIQQLYYLHDLLTQLLPFRDFYPHGLLRTHFQHILSREVQLSLPAGLGSEGTEGLDTVLFELLPGTWNYRWGRGTKSPCGRIEQSALGDLYINLNRIAGQAEFRETGTSFTDNELPADMPKLKGVTVPMLRPTRLTMVQAWNQPLVRREDLLIGDNDEASPADPATHPKQCPTLPRAFPAMWYRIEIPAPAAADATVLAAYPPLGQEVFQRDVVVGSMQVDRYAYAIDRAYGTGDNSPRIHYRHGKDNPAPVVLGDTLMRTDGITFRLRPAVIDAVLDEALGTGPLRGEATLRALRRFIASRGCDPFRSDMVRKVIAAHYLEGGGTLDALNAAAVQTALASLDRTRYDALTKTLLKGVFADDDREELKKSRDQQKTWYEKAWNDLTAVRDNRADFDDAYVRTMGRDLLVHSLSVSALDAASRLAGASDGDLGYFYRGDRHEFYLFDSVDGGNGYAETIHRFLRVTPAQRAHNPDLPSSDWFALFEEVMCACPAQTTARLLFEACRAGVTDKNFHLVAVPSAPVPDLEARMRHEFDPITGAAGVVAGLLANWPTVFRSWRDLLWLQIVPEFFAETLRSKRAIDNHTSLVARSHLCTSGCLECVNNRDSSVHGALFANEHVSRNLLDVLMRHVRRWAPGSYTIIPPGADKGAILKACGDSEVLTAAAPDDATGPLLAPVADGWAVQLPVVAVYHEPAPTP